MTKKFRFMTGLLAIVLAFVMLSSVAYIAAEAGHDCTGADCAICHQIHVCENLLKSIGLAGSAESEASFETISFLAGKVDELNLPCVLTIEGVQHKIAETIVRNTAAKNQKVLMMDSMQSTTSKDAANGTTYLSVMERNLSVLKEALG